MTIKEVVEISGLSHDTLRYYEKQGLIGPIDKTSGGIRDYSEEDLRRIKFVKCMRSAEIPVDVLREYIKLYDQGDDTFEERKKLLENQREILKGKIEDMQKAYELLNDKVDLFYNGKIDEYFKKRGENGE